MVNPQYWMSHPRASTWRERKIRSYPRSKGHREAAPGVIPCERRESNPDPLRDRILRFVPLYVHECPAMDGKGLAGSTYWSRVPAVGRIVTS
jgi:hypothetical protein